MHRGLVAVALACALAVAALAVGAPGAASEAEAADQGHDAVESAAATTGLQEDIDPDDVLMAITVQTDGDAAWTIEYRMRLETDEDEQAFADLRRDIENDSAPYEQRFHDRMNATAENAAETTGREMTVTDMRVSAEKRELPREYGVVTYRFRWTGFAAVDGDRVTAGDAVDGLFLDEDTTLRVAWTADSALLGAAPAPDETRDGAVVWNGPKSFGGGEPRVELGPPGAGSVDGRTAPDSPTAFATLMVLVVMAAGLTGFLYHRRGGRGTIASTADAPGGDADPATAGAAAAPANEEIDPGLLSNEEQVLHLIERNGGRMKQRAVAEELGWTDAKTSQVTKRLREDGDLEGFRLGRENVLALPGEREDVADDGGDGGVEGGDGGEVGSDGDGDGHDCKGDGTTGR